MTSTSIPSNIITVQLPTLSLHSAELEALLERAAKRGAEQAIESYTGFNYAEACKRLGISYPTLGKRIKEGKIRPIDGRIPASEISRYLSQKSGDR